MKKLDNIINRLSSSLGVGGFSYPEKRFLSTKADLLGPCCTAAAVFNKDNPDMNQAVDLLREGARPETPLDRQKEIYVLYLAKIAQSTKVFIDNYCACTGTALDTGSQYNKPEGACKTALENLVKHSDPMIAVRTVQVMQGNPESGTRSSWKQYFLRDWGRVMADTQLKLPQFIEENKEKFRTPSGSPKPTGGPYTTMKSFLDDLCRLKNTTLKGNNAYNIFRGRILSDLQINGATFRTFEEWLASISLITATTQDATYVGCPPSPNDNSIVALAAALGVTTAVAALAYNAITRGKAKKCSDVATASSRLTPLIIAAVGGSFATTQTSEATVQEKLQAVMQKECEGRLPYSCGDGGFEGPDEGDGSGEVDAPGGGGGIEGGML